MIENIQMLKLFEKFKFIGPGLMMAGAAIGVSHLIQSTRAGASYGFSLLLLVLLVNLIKYPFFEYGHRYATATQENLLQGYHKLGKNYLYIFLLLNIISGIIAIAGVTFVTAAIASIMAPKDLNTTMLSFMIMLFCGALIFVGHYKWLDFIIKLIMLVLFFTTLIAFAAAVVHGAVAPKDFVSPSPWHYATLPFLIALMGWMPAPIELSVWQSLWIQAKNNTIDNQLSIKQGKIDFNFGYFLTIILALMFISLGALMMHGSGETFSNSAAGFAGQLVDIYIRLLGAWTKPVVVLAAMCTMFSTTLTVTDAYPRSLAAGMRVAFPSIKIGQRPLQWMWIILCCAVALWIIHAYINHFKQLIDLATSIAFVAGPLFAYLNFKLIHSKHMPDDAKPSKTMRLISLMGLIFLFGFCFLYVYSLFL